MGGASFWGSCRCARPGAESQGALPSARRSYPIGCGLSVCCSGAYSQRQALTTTAPRAFSSEREPTFHSRPVHAFRHAQTRAGTSLGVAGEMEARGFAVTFEVLSHRSWFSPWGSLLPGPSPPPWRDVPEAAHRVFRHRQGEPEAMAMTVVSRVFYQRPKADSHTGVEPVRPSPPPRGHPG